MSLSRALTTTSPTPPGNTSKAVSIIQASTQLDWIRKLGVGFWLAAGFMALLTLLAIAAPLVTQHGPLQQDLRSTLEGPSVAHWLGTDELGRDIYARLVYGIQTTLLTSFSATLLAGSVGTVLGLVAGYFGGWTDGIVMRVMDFLLAIPAVLLALIVIVTLDPGATSALFAVAIVGIPQFARLSRAQTLTLRTREFVLSSRALGASSGRLMLRVILPNALGPLLAQAIVIAALAVFLEAALSFLGLGVPPPHPSWGQMVSAGKTFLAANPGYALFPGLAISLTILSLDTIANRIRSVVSHDEEEFEAVKSKAAG